MKQFPGDIILHKCNTNDNHIIYGSWDNERNGQSFLSSWTIFCKIWKIKILKRTKKHLEILSLSTCVPQMTITWHMVPEIWSMTDRIFCHFGLFLPFYTPNNPKNQNFEKLKKMPWDIIILNMCTINDNHMMYGSWDIEHDTPNLWYFGPSFALLPP